MNFGFYSSIFVCSNSVIRFVVILFRYNIFLLILLALSFDNILRHGCSVTHFFNSVEGNGVVQCGVT